MLNKLLLVPQTQLLAALRELSCVSTHPTQQHRYAQTIQLLAAPPGLSNVSAHTTILRTYAQTTPERVA